MSTPISAAAPYCTAAQFIERVDVRTVGDWLSDTDVRLTPTQVATSGASPGNVLYDLLSEASGMVESAVLRGDRYSVADLQALNGNSQQQLVGIVADLTLYLVWKRRPSTRADIKMPAQCEVAMEMLDQIGAGERIFALQEVADAGVVQSHVETPDEVETRNQITNISRRFFGRRSNDLSPGQNTGGGFGSGWSCW